MFAWVKSLFGQTPRGPARIRASYENARTTEDNSRYWQTVDYLSANSTNLANVRRTLRVRSRHEVSNNPFLYGILNGNADDLIGTGPTLQIHTAKPEYNRLAERLWGDWCQEVDYVGKLRTLKLAREVDGEGFHLFKTVEDLESPVKLYPCDIEAEQFSSPWLAGQFEENYIDGVRLHPITKQPVSFQVLRSHPGDLFNMNAGQFVADTVSARNVVHWFRKLRPQQIRGVPVFTSSLDLFAELRSFRKAVLNNAQIAASLTAVLETDTPEFVNEDGSTAVAPFAKTNIQRGMFTQLPAGMKMSGFDPKQPQTTYEMFQEKVLGESIRPLRYPLNLALGTSQKFNFSSAKLDFLDYRNSLANEREECSRGVLHQTFREWYSEAVLGGAVPAYDGLQLPPHEWHWPGFESIDVAVDSAADASRIASGQLELREFWGKRGRDWRDVLAQLAAEKAELERLGLVFGDVVQRSISEQAVPETENANGA